MIVVTIRVVLIKICKILCAFGSQYKLKNFILRAEFVSKQPMQKEKKKKVWARGSFGTGGWGK